MFAPEDLGLVKGGPALRRRFINMEMGQIAPVYMHLLSDYQRVLQQRNALLKNYAGKQAGTGPFLDVLTDKLITLAADIVCRRLRFISNLNDWAGPIHSEISQGREKLQLIYHSSVREVSDPADKSKIAEAYEKAFSQVRTRESERGTTLVGPHRDDLEFIVNGHDVQLFGSQGQQRTTALSVKLAEIDLIYHETGEYPLLLLDDVLSELDDIRKTHLLAAFKEKVQTFVTTTSIDGLDRRLIDRATLFHIHQGTVVCAES
jgi:recF protein